MSEYESARKVLSNLRSLRAMAREIDFDTLSDMASKLNSVVEELREDAVREAAELAKRDEKRRALLEMISKEGFSIEELSGQAAAAALPRKKREPAQAKYQYEKNGEIQYWSGQGRKPKPIEEALAAGKELDDFLIPVDSKK
jgi:DNA-binding protein StpA